MGSEFNPANTKKTLKKVDGHLNMNGFNFLSAYSPDIIELFVSKVFGECMIEHSVDGSKYKTRFKFSGKTQDDEAYSVEVLMKLFQYGDK